jgi:hypothetical protein
LIGDRAETSRTHHATFDELRLTQIRHPEEAPTGPREARPDDRLRAVAKDERPGLSSFETHRFAMLLRMTTTNIISSCIIL